MREELKQKFRELYDLIHSSEYTLEKHLKINSEISELIELE